VLVSMPVILPAERDLVVCEINQTMVGDGHAMGVAGQIVENVLGPAEWRLGLNDPALAEQGTQEGAKRPFLGQQFRGPGKQSSPF
jgi:hypothetical protein